MMDTNAVRDVVAEIESSLGRLRDGKAQAVLSPIMPAASVVPLPDSPAGQPYFVASQALRLLAPAFCMVS